MPLVTTVDLLRHGESEGGEIFRGATDVLLSEQGWQQMHSALEGLGGWQRVVSSPLQRCHCFAQHFAQDRDIPHAVIDDLSEISFGDWDGRLIADVNATDAESLRKFWRDPVSHTPPNAERVQDFSARVVAAFWAEAENSRGQHILMVVHGGVIRAILGEILQSRLEALVRYEVPHACLSRIKIYHDSSTGTHLPQLVFHNR